MAEIFLISIETRGGRRFPPSELKTLYSPAHKLLITIIRNKLGGKEKILCREGKRAIKEGKELLANAAKRPQIKVHRLQSADSKRKNASA